MIPVSHYIFQLIIILLLTLLIWYRTSYDRNAVSTHTFLLQRGQFLQRCLEQFHNRLTVLYRLKHDHQNHLRILRDQDMAAAAPSLWFCPVPVLNTLLIQKYNACLELGFRADFLVQNISHIWTDDYTLVCILSNLLDNALNSNETCSERYLILRVYPAANYVLIRMENPVGNPEPLRPAGHSSRTPPAPHGHGRAIIAACVKAYDGQMEEHYSDTGYDITISLTKES